MSLRQNLSGSTLDSNPDNLELELENVLTATDSLNDEVTLCLIKNLKIPSPTTTPPSTDKDVLFPAYLINLATSKMWNKGFVKRPERFSSSVIHCIQHEITQHEVEDAIYSDAFWLFNVREILSFVFIADDWYGAWKISNDEYDRLQEIVKCGLETFEFNICHTWMKVLKKKLQKMIVPAIIESQSLPGFVTSEGYRVPRQSLTEQQYADFQHGRPPQAAQ